MAYHKLTPAIETEILALNEVGMSQTQIGETVGMAQSSVSHILRRLGKAPGKGKWKRKDWVTPEYRKRYRMNHHTQKRFGLSVDEYDALKASSPFCILCGKPEPDNLDHNEATGKIRKFLCGSCNRGLGLFHHDAERLRKAAEYLEDYN